MNKGPFVYNTELYYSVCTQFNVLTTQNTKSKVQCRVIDPFLLDLQLHSLCTICQAFAGFSHSYVQNTRCFFLKFLPHSVRFLLAIVMIAYSSVFCANLKLCTDYLFISKEFSITFRWNNTQNVRLGLAFNQFNPNGVV